MTRRIDCAVLALPALEDWLGPVWQAPALGAIHLHRLSLAEGGWDGDTAPQTRYPVCASEALARQAPALARFDVCVLPVSPDTLAWTRVALAAAMGSLPVPVLLLVRQVAARATGDLLALGATDFIAHAARLEELKARLTHWAARRPVPGIVPERPARLPAPLPGHAAIDVGPAVRALAQAADSPTNYRASRADVLARFERDYVTGMLLRFRGNVTHAARAGNQDRRAFWQLMRKYGVLSADFRRADRDDAMGAGANR